MMTLIVVLADELTVDISSVLLHTYRLPLDIETGIAEFRFLAIADAW